MNRATSIMTALFFVGSLSAGKTSFASEETSSVGANTRIAPSSETSQERNVLRELAVALAAGGEALSSFRGSAIANEEEKDRLNPAIPGMDCDIDIDLIGRPQTQGTYSYLVTIFGWTATEPRL